MDIKKGNENQEIKKKSERHPKFYVALLVCLAAVSAAGWSTYKTVKEFITPQKKMSSPRASRVKENQSVKETSSKENILESSSSNIEKEKSRKHGSAIPYETKNETTTDNQNQPTEEESKEVWAEKSKEAEISYPGTSEVSKEFSDGNPVYSKTLDDWRSHEGTDFKAPKGSAVKSISSGIVTDIYDDPSYGTTLVVSHDGRFTAYYSGLDKNVPIKKGDKIKCGDEIGIIGEVPCEILDESHLHLAINKDGKFIDPLLILDKEN